MKGKTQGNVFSSIKREQNLNEKLFSKALQAKKKIGLMRKLIKGSKKDGENISPDKLRRAEYQKMVTMDEDFDEIIMEQGGFDGEIKEESEEENEQELELEEEKEIDEMLEGLYNSAEKELEEMEIEAEDIEIAEEAIELVYNYAFGESNDNEEESQIAEKKENEAVPWKVHGTSEKEELKEDKPKEVEEFLNGLFLKITVDSEKVPGTNESRRLSSSFKSQMRRFSQLDNSATKGGLDKGRSFRFNNSRNDGIDLSIEPIEIHSNPYISTPSNVTSLTPRDPRLRKEGRKSEASSGKRSSMKEIIAEHGEEEGPLKQIGNKGKKEKKSVPLLGPYRQNEQNLRVPTEAELMHMENPSGYHIDLLKPNGIFCDNAFPPCPMSLLRNSRKTKPKLSHWKSFTWNRLPSFFGFSNMSLCSEIKPASFSHGSISNHYFLAVLSALAENPTQIRRLFGDQEENKFGVYHVLINLRGIWRNVIVDDMIPIQNEEKKLAFCAPKSPSADGTFSIWPILMEKAWAKVFLNYENIAQHVVDAPSKVLRDLTGAPSYTYIHQQGNEANLFRVMEDCYRSNFILLAETNNVHEENHFCPFFTVLQVAKNEKRQKCVRLRNYETKWDPEEEITSSSLDQDYKTKVKTVDGRKEDIGIREDWSKLKENESIILFKEFARKCTKIHVCLYQEAWEYESIVVRHQRNAFSIVSFEVKEKTRCHLEISQVDEQFYGETLLSRGFYKYSPGRLFIVRHLEETDEYEMVDGAFTLNERTTFVPLELKEGKYFALVSVDWGSKIFDIVLNYYSSTKFTSLIRVDMKSLSFLLVDSVGFYSLIHGKSEPLNQSGDLSKSSIHKPEWGLWILSFVNKTTKTVTIVAEFTEKNDVKVEGSLSNNRVQVSVAPGEYHVVLAKYKGSNPRFAIGPCEIEETN